MEATPYGKYLHVGGDEVQTTGRKSGKSALELNLIWLNKVSAFAEKHNRIPIFWDDMLLKQGEVYYPIYDLNISKQKVDSIWEVNEPKLNKFIKQFPENCIYMRWNYHATESYGNARAMDWFTNNGLKVMGATAGQTRWTLMPQRESNIDQIRIFADQSIKRNFNGLLLTLWDDDSPHFELYKRGISAFAEYTWGGIKRTKSEFKSVFRHRTFGSEFQSEEYAFIDFEHSGLDDSSKFVVDWILQPDNIMTSDQANYFLRLFLDYFECTDFEKRIYWMLRLYRVKWCCIILNTIFRTDNKDSVNHSDVINYSFLKSKKYYKNSLELIDSLILDIPH